MSRLRHAIAAGLFAVILLGVTLYFTHGLVALTFWWQELGFGVVLYGSAIFIAVAILAAILWDGRD